MLSIHEAPGLTSSTKRRKKLPLHISYKYHLCIYQVPNTETMNNVPLASLVLMSQSFFSVDFLSSVPHEVFFLYWPLLSSVLGTMCTSEIETGRSWYVPWATLFPKRGKGETELQSTAKGKKKYIYIYMLRQTSIRIKFSFPHTLS